jgi:hypothetical protein
MSRSSYVSIARGVCVVCGEAFEAGTLMIEKRLLVDSCVVGWTMCAADAQMHKLGFIAIVECELDPTERPSGDTVEPNEVNRTGNVMHLTRDTFANIFKTEVRSGLPCAYVARGALQQVQAILRRELN